MTDGRSWVSCQIPRPSRPEFSTAFLSAVDFVDQNHGWIVGMDPYIMSTPDGGATWYQQSVPSQMNDRLSAVDFVNASHGWAAGHDGYILRTTTGGGSGVRLGMSQYYPFFPLILMIPLGIGLFGIIVVIFVSFLGAFLWSRYRRLH